MASTVKVKLLTARIDGSESNVSGDIISVDAREAKVLIETAQAEPVAEPRAKRTAKATAPKPESR